MTWFADDVVKVEVRFDGSTWVNLSSPTNYVILSEPLQIERGRDDEFADPMNPGVLELLLVNDDGRFTPDLPSSPYYPYVVPDVAIKVSVYVNGAWQTRFYGSVQSWSVRLGDEGGYTSTCAVTATDTLGDFPEYVFRQAADEVVRNTAGMVAHFPLRDSGTPISSLIGAANLTDNAPATSGWGEGALPLAMEEGEDRHPLFTSASGGMQATVQDLPAQGSGAWRLRFVLMAKPSATCDLLKMSGLSGILYLGWSSASGFTTGLTTAGTPVGIAAPASWPVVVEVGSTDPISGITRVSWSAADGSATVGSVGVGFSFRAPLTVVINPTLSGGATWSIGHLTLMSGDQDATELGDYAEALLGARVPTAESAVSMVQRFAGAPTISGTTLGNYKLPLMDGRDAADAMAALALGMGARIRDNLDGTLQWIDFTPSATPTTMPSEKIDPALTWETSTVGWMSDCTETETDGTTYTATRTDGRRASYSTEGVHSTAIQNRSYADWLVSTASTKARLSQATYEISSLSDANQAIVAGIKIGDRITIGSLPSAILPASLTLIVEGITDSISDDGWSTTFQTSPDVYSRLFILDDAAEVRRNYATIPNPTSTTGWITNNGTLYVSSYDATGGRRAGTGARKLTRAATSPSTTIASVYAAGLSAWSVAQRVPVTEGEVWTVSSYSKASVAFTTSVAVLFFDASNVQVGSAMTGSSEAGSAGGWARPSVTVTVPSGATNMGISAQLVSMQSGVTSGGEVVWMTDALYEKVSSVDAYFDGSYSPDANDLIPSWTGAANASPSILTGGAGILDSSYILAP